MKIERNDCNINLLIKGTKLMTFYFTTHQNFHIKLGLMIYYICVTGQVTK